MGAINKNKYKVYAKGEKDVFLEAVGKSITYQVMGGASGESLELLDAEAFDKTTQWGADLENMIVNGDFSDGLTDWDLAGAGGGAVMEIDETIYISANKSIKANMTSAAGAYVIPKQSVSCTDTHKYYIRSNIRNDNEDMNSLGLRIIPNNVQVQVNPEVVNEWKLGSFIYTANGLETFIYLLASMTASEVGNAWFDEVKMVDLTEAFGAGNEPTKEWCDEHITSNPRLLGVPRILSFEGKSEQLVTVQGKNLFDKDTVTNGYYLNESGGLVANSNYCVSDYIPVTEGETYYTPLRGTSRTKFFDSSKTATTATWDVMDGATSFVVPAGVSYIRMSINITTVDIDTFQFEEGDTATDYEAFVPDSPSSNYPAPISNGADSKNLLQNNLTTQTLNGVTFTVNDDKSITIVGTATARTEPNICTSCFTLKDGITYKNVSGTILYFYSSGFGYISIADNGTYTPTGNIEIDRVYIRVENGETINDTIYPMLIINGNDETYIPYNSIIVQSSNGVDTNELLIDLPDGMLMAGLPNGTIDDIVDKVPVQRISKVVLDGSRTWTLYRTKTNTIVFRTDFDEVCSILDNDGTLSDNLQSNRFKSLSFNDVYGLDIEGQCKRTFENKYYVSINQSELDTIDVAGFETWLASNNVTLLYELATPITHDSINTDVISLLDGENTVESENATKVDLTIEYPLK